MKILTEKQREICIRMLAGKWYTAVDLRADNVTMMRIAEQGIIVWKNMYVGKRLRKVYAMSEHSDVQQ